MSGEAAGPDDQRTGRRIPPVAVAVAGVVAAFVTILAWGLSSPPGSAPDEHYHLASIWCGHGNVPGRCDAGVAPNVRMIPNPVGSQQCFTNSSRTSAACRGPAYGQDMPAESSTWIGNWNGAYPPVFYWTMSWFVVGDLDPSVVLVRGVNALVAVVLVGGLAVLLPPTLRRVTLTAALVTSVPLGLFITASANPSSWAYLSALALWPAVHGAFEQRGWRRYALWAWILGATVVGAGARADAALFCLLAVGLGLLLSLPRVRRDWPTTAVCVVAALVAAWLFRGSGQSEVVTGGVPGFEPSPHSGAGLLLANALELPELWFGAVGLGPLARLGWFDTPMPWVVGLGTLLVLGILLVPAWAALTWRKALALGVAVAAAVAYPLVLLQRSDAEIGQVVQARYVLPLLVLVVGISLLPRDGRPAPTRRQGVVLAVVLTVAHAVALYTNLLRYTHGLPKTGLASLDAPAWWWDFVPAGPWVVFLAGALAFAVVAAAVLVPTRLTLGPEASTIEE